MDMSRLSPVLPMPLGRRGKVKTVFAFLDKDVFAGAGVSLVAVGAPFCALLVRSLVLGCQAHERGSVSCFHI